MKMQPRMLPKSEQESAPAGAPEKEEGLFRSEKYLLAAALVMGALLILYNALSSVPLASPQVVQVGAVQNVSGSDPNAAGAVSGAASAVETKIPGDAVSQPAEASYAESTGSGKLQPGETIDLNAASVEELMRLPGVGEKTASAICRLRQEIGPFHSVGDLIYVDGIGQKTVEKLAPYLRVSE